MNIENYVIRLNFDFLIYFFGFNLVFFYEQSVWMASTVELLKHPPSEAALGRTLSEILASVKTSDVISQQCI